MCQSAHFQTTVKPVGQGVEFLEIFWDTSKNKHPERDTERYVVAQVHVFKLESWEQEKFQTEVFINH